MKTTNSIKIFQTIISSAQTYLDELCASWDVYEKQSFFVNAIAIYDHYFVDSLSTDTHDSNYFRYRVIRYGYPVFIKQFYDPKFCELPGTALKAMDHKHLELYAKIVYSCGIIGWMQNFIDSISAGVFTSYSFLNIVRVKFTEKYHWIEYLEQEYLTWYSSMVASIQKDRYDILNEELPEVLQKLKTGVFVWKDSFMGYQNDLSTEEFFQSHAYLDAQQSTSWDTFPPDCTFGRITYADFVHAIVELSGYAIKHLYCARILQNLHPELIFDNLMCCLFEESELTKLVGTNRGIAIGDAHSLLEMISLSPKNLENSIAGNTRYAPYIKVSRTQYLHSIAGLLDDPFLFLLAHLRKNYPSDWDRNVNLRESTFREQLYRLFDDPRFICINRPVIIKENGNVVTDIDATVIDKQTGAVALFQLKWQDPTATSLYSLKSKKVNFSNETSSWIHKVTTWIGKSSNAEIANLLGIKARYLEKENIKLFVLGRQHSCYSGDIQPQHEICAWCQWYQLLQTIKYLGDRQLLSLESLHATLKQTTPFSKRIIERTNKFIYGKYRIYFGGNQ